MMSYTRMSSEAAEAASVVSKQLEENAKRVEELGAVLRALSPRAIVTCARGSSDHAATFAKYLIESRTPVLTSSAAPSLSSMYGARPDLRDVAVLAISQSGRSPDLLAAVGAAKERGAVVIALCNKPDSPLADASTHFVPLLAGEETSVAATKTYIASLAAIAQLVACWTEDRGLRSALAQVPELLTLAWMQDWSEAVTVLQPAQNLFVVGRGYGLAIAQEAALKFKETCALHAEAFSAAEVKHGPMALVSERFPVLMFTQDDETRLGVEALAGEFARRGARVLLAGGGAPGALHLPTLPAHSAIAPLLLIQSFYRMAANLALARGLNPDSPPYLNKVTETL